MLDFHLGRPADHDGTTPPLRSGVLLLPLEDQVPEHHLLRLIDKHVSFEFLRQQLKDSYSETSRPSNDPELLLLILLIASDLDMPRIEQRLPRAVLSETEAETGMLQTDIRDPLGLRDHAIFETFYSTGIRRTELVNLKLYNRDRERGTLSIWQGKGKKDRIIPIGERAGAWSVHTNDRDIPRL